MTYNRARFTAGEPPHEGEPNFLRRLRDWLRAEFDRVQRGIPWQGPTVDIRDFSPRANGTADDSAPLQRAMTATAAASGTLFLPSGYSYAASGLSVSGSSLRVRGQGATLVQCADDELLTLVGGYSSTTAITAILATTYDFEGEGTTPVSRLTFAALPSVSVGDYVKVVCDDQLAGTRAAVGSGVARRGEYAVVGALDAINNYVYLRGLLRDTYTTSPRMAVLRDVTFELDGLTLSAAASGDAAGWDSRLVEIRAARSVKLLNFTTVRSWTGNVRLVGVKGYSVFNMRCERLANDPGDNRYGYGVDDVSCEDGRISHCDFGDCRHGVTTNVDPVTAGSSSIEYFGPSTGGRVAFCHGMSGSAASFDTHLGSRDWEFSHCRSSNAYWGQTSNQAGFSFRGIGIRAIDCVSDADAGGYYVQDEGISGGTDDIHLINCRAKKSGRRSLLVAALAANVTVDGGEYEGGVGVANPVFRVDEASVLTLRGGVRIVKGGSSDDIVELNDTATLKIEDAVFDFNEITEANGNVVSFQDAGTSAVGKNMEVVCGSITPVTFFRSNTGTKGTVDVRDIRMDVQPSTAITSGVTSARYSARLTDNSWSSDYQTFSVTADSQVPTVIGELADDLIYLQIASDAADGATWTLGALPDGYRPGQRLVIRNRSTGFGHVTISGVSGTSNADMGFTMELADRDAVEFVWSDTLAVWVLVGRWNHGYQPALMTRASLADADATLTPTSSPWHQHLSATLTALRTVTLDDSRGIRGQPNFRIWRTGAGAFNLDVDNHDGTLLKSLATGEWAEFMFDGTDYHLIAFGSL